MRLLPNDAVSPKPIEFVFVVVVNFGGGPAPKPPGQVVLASGSLDGDGTLPANTAVWLREEKPAMDRSADTSIRDQMTSG